MTALDPVDFHGRIYERQPGMLYMSTRAISAAVNLNYDAWPSDELELAYETFIGSPVYVDHHSDDKNRARGIILDSIFIRSEDDAWIDLLLEIDAEAYPMLAHEIVTGGLDSVSMGCYVQSSECSYCGNVYGVGEQLCAHLEGMRGDTIDGQLVYEICRGIEFYEISLVFEPADVTAVAKTIISNEYDELISKTAASYKSDYNPNFKKINIADYTQSMYDDPPVDIFPFSYSNEDEAESLDIFDINPYARIQLADEDEELLF